MNKQLVYTPELLALAEATMCESDSFYFIENYFQSFPLQVEYNSAKYSVDTVIKFSTLFSTFHGKVNLGSSSSSSIPSIVPIDVFRYKMLDDGSWYYINTLPTSYKPGYIVEGALWSNGMYYLVREENKSEFLDAVFYVDQYTKALYNYP